MHNPFYHWLDRNRDLGIFFLRAFIGIRLIYGVADNILSWHHMLAFRDFLQGHRFPFPLIAAHVSVYAQFICGLMFLFGFRIRIAAIVMIINFLVALLMVHRSDSFEGMTPALAILFSSVVFLFQGAGELAVERNSEESKVK